MLNRFSFQGDIEIIKRKLFRLKKSNEVKKIDA